VRMLQQAGVELPGVQMDLSDELVLRLHTSVKYMTKYHWWVNHCGEFYKIVDKIPFLHLVL
jgi:hypothetical protein